MVAICSGNVGYCAKRKRKERPNQSNVPAGGRGYMVSKAKKCVVCITKELYRPPKRFFVGGPHIRHTLVAMYLN